MPPEKSLADDLADNSQEAQKKTGKEEDDLKLDDILSQKFSTPEDEEGAGKEQEGLVFNIGLKENDSSSSDDLEFHKLPKVFATPSKSTNDKAETKTVKTVKTGGNDNDKQKDKQNEDSMQIDGCYFPKLDDMMDSDNSQELNLAYRTFLDDSKQKKVVKQDVSKKSQSSKDKVAAS